MFALAPRTLLDSAVVAEQALAAQAGHGIEGVTFLGGEPMLQARGLADVARRIGPAGLSVMVFSGYTLEQLQAGTLPGAAELLAQADLFVDGPFDATRPDPRRNWIGSVNQRIHFLTDRYAPGIEYEPRFGRAMEIRVTKQGAVHINGWPEPFPHRAGRL
jgi:anaerobic ribonucleoside-triphosphate reductase activating protein